MAKDSRIEWTDHTFNGWWGCTKVSPGCKNCYAEEWDARFGGDHFGVGKPRRTFGDRHWRELTLWNEAARRDGVVRKCFVNSMSDVMDAEVDDALRVQLYQAIDKCDALVFQFLTK